MASGACLLAAYDAPLVRVRKALDEKEMPAAQGGQVPRAQGCTEAWLPLRHETISRPYKAESKTPGRREVELSREKQNCTTKMQNRTTKKQHFTTKEAVTRKRNRDRRIARRRVG
jgi:hypothetical protein